MNKVKVTWLAVSLVPVAAALCMSSASAAIDIPAACKAGAKGWEQIVAEGKKEGEVLFYSTNADADNQRLLDGFMKKYPDIKANAIRLVGNAMAERVDSELKAGAPTGDVVVFSDPKWNSDKLKSGALIAPCGPSVPLWAKAGALYPDKELVPLANEPWVFAYNTNLVKNKPKDWNDLVKDKQFTGRVGLNEVSGMTVAIWADVVSKHAGADYFDRLAPLKPRIYPNSAPLTQAIIAGEVAWSPYSLASTIEPLKAKGAPIEWIVPNSGSYMLQRFAMVLKAAPNPAAGMLLLDYAMSQEGQTLINGNLHGVTVAPGIRIDSELKVDLKKAGAVDQSKYGPETLTKWVNKFNQLYR